MSDVPGLLVPTWRAVVEREYEPWNRPRVAIDTAILTVEQSVAHVLEVVVGPRREEDEGGSE